MKLKYPIHQWTLLVGDAEPAEDTPAKLAAGRAAAVEKLMFEFGLTKSPLEVKSHVDEPPIDKRDEEFSRSAQIDLVPGCLDDCCD